MTEYKNNTNGLVTAYESNSRAGGVDTKQVSTEWHTKINHLLANDYSFLPLCYEKGGVLFRGMHSGIVQSIITNSFINFSSSNPHSALEQELDVYFVSHELSDAFTVARIWEENDDSGLLCFSTEVFREEYEKRSAAIMAFSEPGFVFNYPFLTQGLKIENVFALYVNAATYNQLKNTLDSQLFAKLSQILIVLDNAVIATGRTAVENTIKQHQNNNAYSSARLIEVADFPKK